MARSVQVLTAETGTTAAPSAATDGVETNSLKVGGNVPDAATIVVQSTAGSGTMTVTLKLWGYDDDSAKWSPVGTHSTAASKGILNEGAAIPEGPIADTINHREILRWPGHFDRLDIQVTAIGGSATAVSVWIRVESDID